MERLRTLLRRIDGKGYKAYKELEGTYDFGFFRLDIDHVQGDPFAAPSRLSVFVPASEAAFPAELCGSRVRRIALEDFLGRAVKEAIGRHVRGRRGIGKSGEWEIATSGQQILVRNAVLVTEAAVEARLTAGLPAAGRSIRGRDAGEMMLEELPLLVRRALLYRNLDAKSLLRHIESAEDQEHLRRLLTDEGLVAFVADGSLLPRRSGIDDRPLDQDVIPFRAPESLARILVLPHAGPVRGLGIPQGVTLIVGGGFHGKSTLLRTLERGVYDHIPGDGREKVATLASAVKIRAEDGRAIHDVDISPFINHLPLERDTVRFSSENASGSTSQAANIVEALQCAAEVLLIDEDTSATNFMIRDRRMQRLVSDDKEPITPLLHRVRALHRCRGVSSVIVMGGSGDYLEVADTVIMLDAYRLRDVTALARQIVGEDRAVAEVLPVFPALAPSPPLERELSPLRGGKEKIESRGIGSLLYGRHEIDLSRLEQLVDSGQTRSIGLLLRAWTERSALGGELDGLRSLLEDVEREGLDLLSRWKRGDLALPRLHEAAAAIRRLRH